MNIVGLRQVAERSMTGCCYVEDCSGRLFDKSWNRTIPFGSNPNVGRGQIACDGHVMHVWNKHSLINLRPILVASVKNI